MQQDITWANFDTVLSEDTFFPIECKLFQFLSPLQWHHMIKASQMIGKYAVYSTVGLAKNKENIKALD